MIPDPLRRLPTGLRLAAAAVLSVLPLGLLWTYAPGLQSIGGAVYGDCGYSGEVYVCNPDVRIPGIYVGSTSTVAQSPLRVFLIGAFVALVVVAVRTRTEATRRIARVGTVCLLVAALLAAGHRSAPTLVCVLAALALSAPPAWRNPRNQAVFGRAPLNR